MAVSWLDPGPSGRGCGCTPQDWAPLAWYLLATCNLHWFLSLLTSCELPKAYGKDYFLLILKKKVNRINPLIFLVCLRVTPLNFDIKPPPPIISMLYVFCLVFLLDLTNYHKPYDWKQHRVILQFQRPQVQSGSHGLKSQCRQDGISSGDCREDLFLVASSSLEPPGVTSLPLPSSSDIIQLPFLPLYLFLVLTFLPCSFSSEDTSDFLEMTWIIQNALCISRSLVTSTKILLPIR